jgi:HYR domain
VRALAVTLALVSLTACADECATATPCGARVELACTAANTPVQIPASGVSGCTFAATPTSLAVGTHAVQLAADDGTSCAMSVTVVDRDPPTLSCAGVSAALRLERGAEVALPSPPVTDRCTDRVNVTSEPARTTARGPVAVRYAATDGAGNEARCEASVTVQNAFAASGLRVVHAELFDDRTTVTLVWDHPADSDATGYRVERATTTTGPWMPVATFDTDTTRYGEELATPVAFFRVVTRVGERDGAATTPVRALAVSATSYDLGPLPVPGLALPANAAARTEATMSAPLRAVVRSPADLTRGPFPLVLLLHGNHGNCRLSNYDRAGVNPARDDVCQITNTGACRSGTRSPNAEGLSYLAATLASHGYIVASVDANALNCRDGTRAGRADGFIGQRARLLVEHMRRWRTWNAPGGAAPFDATFAGHVDLSRVGLFGHSRGAEAVASVPGVMASSTDVDGIGLGAVFSLAPTNFDNPQPGGVPFATLVPTCDGDVFTYDGVQLYDRTLRNDDATLSAQLFVRRMNHDFFNTEWRFDDNAFGVQSCSPGEVADPEIQPRFLEATVSAWFDGTLPTGASLEPWMRAVGDVPAGIVRYADAPDPLDVRRSYSSPHVARIDDFARSELGVNLLGGAYTPSGSFDAMSPRTCTGSSTPPCDERYVISSPQGPIRFAWPHANPFVTMPARGALALDWAASNAALAVDLGAGGATFDATMYRALSLRVASRTHRLNPSDRAAQDFEVALVDADGHRGTALASEVTTVPHLYPTDYPRAVLQTVRFTLSGLAARATPAVDLRRLRRIELRFSAEGLDTGSLLLDDVEFAD